MNILCRLGIHRTVDMPGAAHRHWECTRCGKRGVVRMQDGYAPVNSEWLDGGEWDDRAEPFCNAAVREQRAFGVRPVEPWPRPVRPSDKEPRR